jgi:hypothetical protein
MSDLRIYEERQVHEAIETVLDFEPRLLDGDYSPDDQQAALVFFPVLLTRLNNIDRDAQARKGRRHEEKYGPGGRRCSPEKKNHQLRLVVKNPDPLEAA